MALLTAGTTSKPPGSVETRHSAKVCSRFRLLTQMVVDAWGAVYSAETGLDLIERLDFLPLEGRVQLTDPDVKFWLVIVDTTRVVGGLPQVPRRPLWPALIR